MMTQLLRGWCNDDPANPKRVALTLNGQRQSEKFRMIAADEIGAIMVPSTEDRSLFFPWTAITSVATACE